MELYLPAISRAVSIFGMAVNSRGLSREDYEIELVAHLWQHSLGDFVDQELVEAILRNKVRDYQRKNRNKLPTEIHIEETVDGLEQYTINRELIRLLKVVLSIEDWNLLVLYLENDCNVRQTWIHSSVTKSCTVFKKRIRSLLFYCREVIQTLCNYRSNERVIN
jgi:hypothetical protein